MGNEADFGKIKLEPYKVSDIFNSGLLRNEIKKALDLPGNNTNSQSKSDFSTEEILIPPYDLEQLSLMKYLSDSLYSCIQAYAVNISGFGYQLNEDSETYIENGKRYYSETGEPVPDEINKALKNQYSDIDMFFNSVSMDIPWVTLQTLKTETKYTTGNAYYEIERDGKTNKIQGLSFVECENIRLTKRVKELVKVDQLVKNKFTKKFEIKTRFKYFRKYVQLSPDGVKKYFKEINDPRLMNALTGEYYKNDSGEYILNNNIPVGFFDKLKSDGKKFVSATELWYFKIHATNDIDGYGVPPWVSLIPMLLGVHFSDLSVFHTMQNKGLPEALLIVEGAKAKDIIKELNDEFAQNKKLQKYKSLLVVGAEGVNGGTNVNPVYKNPSIRLESLNMVLAKEGLEGKAKFADSVNERVAGVFRLPSFFLGKLHNVNRSVAEVAVDYANEQVFTPESQKDDAEINMYLMPELDSTYYSYASKRSKNENTELKLKTVQNGVISGVILPGEGRKIYSEILGKNLENISNEFMNTPYPVSIRSTGNNNNNKVIKLNSSSDSEIFNNLKKHIEETQNIKIDSNDVFILGK